MHNNATALGAEKARSGQSRRANSAQVQDEAKARCLDSGPTSSGAGRCLSEKPLDWVTRVWQTLCSAEQRGVPTLALLVLVPVTVD
jgi:hypothetical protein